MFDLLHMPLDETQQMAKALRRLADKQGRIIGKYDNCPALNTLVYDVEFPDGMIKQYAGNVIAENILE